MFNYILIRRNGSTSRYYRWTKVFIEANEGDIVIGTALSPAFQSKVKYEIVSRDLFHNLCILAHRDEQRK